MRRIKLKEKDYDIYLRLEASEDGALLVIERPNEVEGTILLSLKQLANVSEWISKLTDEWFKEHKIASKGQK